jgi:hypothetical protein
MGNASIHFDGDDPTPCWSCQHFMAVQTSRIGWLFVRCADRGTWTQADPAVGCRRWVLDDEAQALANSFNELEGGSQLESPPQASHSTGASC